MDRSPPDIAGHRISQTTKSHMTYYLRVPVNATLLDPFGDRCGTLHLLPGHPLEALDAEGGFFRRTRRPGCRNIAVLASLTARCEHRTRLARRAGHGRRKAVLVACFSIPKRRSLTSARRLSPRSSTARPIARSGVDRRLHEKGQPVDPVNVQRTLIERKWLDHVGGPAVVLELFSFVPTAAHAEFYARLVIEAHRLRELIRIATRAIQEAYGKPETPEALIDRTCSELMGIGRIAGIDSRRMTADEMAAAWLDVQDADQSEASPHVAVPMGIECFDREPQGIGGMKADYLVIAAETSGGKTVFCIQGPLPWLSPAVGSSSSYEVSALQIFNRAVAHYGCIPNPS